MSSHTTRYTYTRKIWCQIEICKLEQCTPCNEKANFKTSQLFFMLNDCQYFFGKTQNRILCCESHTTRYTYTRKIWCQIEICKFFQWNSVHHAMKKLILKLPNYSLCLMTANIFLEKPKTEFCVANRVTESVSPRGHTYFNCHSVFQVLDMCAAPGSKTAQLIEMIHANDERTPSSLPCNSLSGPREF